MFCGAVKIARTFVIFKGAEARVAFSLALDASCARTELSLANPPSAPAAALRLKAFMIWRRFMRIFLVGWNVGESIAVALYGRVRSFDAPFATVNENS